MLSEDESDLTDLDQLSQEYEETRPAKKKGKGKGKAKAGEYRIRHALKAPRATTYSTEALYKQIHNGDIDLDPEYQREVVWPESKQIGIIDSIFRNFYVPPVIFAVNTLDDGTETRTCIDGKQRLTSIFRFLEGLIPHKDSLTGDKLWYRDNPDHRTRAAKKILPEKYRNMFDGRAVVCIEYQDLQDADEREIFQRVQLGVALTPAEKLKVLNTPRAQFIRTLQDDFLNNEASGLGGAALAWDRSRGSDFRCLSQTIQCIVVSPKTTSIQATEKWLADPAPLAPSFASSIENTYYVFEALVRDPRNNTLFSKIAPIEFITIGILVHRHKARLSLEALGKAVAAMRADVRRVHDDIRNNSKVYKTMNAFIDGYVGPSLARGEVSAADAVGQGFPQPSGAKAGTKRKAVRAAADEDEEDAMDVDGEDSDDDYAPARKAAPRKRASPQKKAPAAPTRPPVPPPTPPTSTSSPPTAAAPGPGSPPATQNAIDRIRALREQYEAQRLSAAAGVAPGGLQPTPTMLPSPNLTPFSYNPEGAAHAQHPYQQQQHHGQQRTQHGAAGVAAVLEANLMGGGGGGGGGGTSSGPRVKTEPGALPLSAGSNGAPPYSAGSNGSGGYDGGRYGSGSASSSGHRGGGYDRERDSRDRRAYDEYDYSGRDKQRYRERERPERRW